MNATEYTVYFSSEDIEPLSEAHRQEIYEYLRLYNAEVQYMIRKADRKSIELYKVQFPGYLIEQLTGRKLNVEEKDPEMGPDSPRRESHEF